MSSSPLFVFTLSLYSYHCHHCLTIVCMRSHRRKGRKRKEDIFFSHVCLLFSWTHVCQLLLNISVIYHDKGAFSHNRSIQGYGSLYANLIFELRKIHKLSKFYKLHKKTWIMIINALKCLTNRCFISFLPFILHHRLHVWWTFETVLCYGCLVAVKHKYLRKIFHDNCVSIF